MNAKEIYELARKKEAPKAIRKHAFFSMVNMRNIMYPLGYTEKDDEFYGGWLALFISDLRGAISSLDARDHEYANDVLEIEL